jgi:hypothetical protein
MFSEGTIVYFDPFYFKNGNTAKPKYFLVLKQLSSSNTLIASLPTRKDNTPTNELSEFGCIELPDNYLNCFVIPANMSITQCEKSFPFKTFLYGHQIETYSNLMLQELYPIEGSDFIIWGKMKQSLFEELIVCFKNSKSVKRKFKQVL